jgi:hypothetical protein
MASTVVSRRRTTARRSSAGCRCSHGRIWLSVGTVRAMSGVVACSIVLVDRWSDVDLTELAGRAEAPEARGLISISEESWPQPAGSTAVREILGLREGHPGWLDVERQLRAADKPARACHPA